MGKLNLKDIVIFVALIFVLMSIGIWLMVSFPGTNKP